jgi:3-oxoacyl-[acyl-carrier protein] reductase
MTGALAGKVVLVTGGGAGLGREICIACADAGASVVVAAPRDNGAETAEAITSAGGVAQWVRTDVTVADDVEAAIKTTVETYGGLDAVVHNATSRYSSAPVAIEDLTDDVFADHVAVSIRGAYNCARLALPRLQQRSGRLVLMTSPAAMEATATLPAYGVVKGALRGLAKSLAIEWGPLGVTVALVSPLALTPALDTAMANNPALEPRLRAVVPLGRIGDSRHDVAPVVTFLISDDARYVTGQTLVVDGGRYTGL